MDFRNYRYLYRLPVGSKYYPDGHYGCMAAVSMADAKEHLSRSWRGFEVRRIRVSEDDALLVERGTQEHRKQLFDAAKKTDRR